MMESKEMAMKIAKLLDERKAIDVQVIDIAPEIFLCRLFCHGIGRKRETDGGAGRQYGRRCWNRKAYSQERRGKAQLRLDTDGLRRCGRQRDDSRDARKIQHRTNLGRLRKP